MKTNVSLVKCQSYDPDLVLQATRKAVALLGGADKFIKPKSRVLIKPNLLLAKPPEAGITTHPEVVRAVIRILKEMDCSIAVGDGPSVWGGDRQQPQQVYEVTGMRQLCAQENVELVVFDKMRWRGKFPLAGQVDACDFLVNIPKFKTHNLTLLTGAVKNLYGLLSGTYKTELHKDYFDPDDFARIVVDIYAEAKPVLNIVDAITAMEGDGPGTSGKLRQEELIIAGSDGVAVDSVLARLMGIEPSLVLTIKEACARGLGVGNIDSIAILGEKLEEAKKRPFILPASSGLRDKIPRPLIDFAKSLIRFYPCVEDDKCNRCNICIKACPNKAMRLENYRVLIDYRKCIHCFCCQEICPESAIKTGKSLTAKLLKL